MKKISLVIIYLIFLSLPALAESLPPESYPTIFNSLPKINSGYDFNEDPQEYIDYQSYVWSPYPLMRTSTNLYTPKGTIPTGYYLLTPRVHDGIDCVLFKEKGVIKAVVPVFAKELIPPEKMKEIYKLPPPPKTPWWKLPVKGVKFVFGKIFIHTKKGRPFPKALIETYEPSPDFYQIDLYYENYIYKMVFKTKNRS